MILRSIFLALIWVAILAAPSLAGYSLEKVTLTVQGNASESVSEDLRNATPRLLEEIEEQIGLDYQGDVSLVLCTTRQSFVNYYKRFGENARAEVLGVAYPLTSSIALNLQLIAQTASTPESVYKHELCHLVLAEHIGYPGVLRPLWFEEGTAQFVSETAYESAQAAVVHASGQGRDPHSLGDVSAMAASSGEMAEGYAHAVAAVEDIVSRFGIEAYRELLQNLSAASRQPQPPRFEQVFGETFKTSFAAWEREFIASRERMDVTRVLLFIGANAFAVTMLIAVLIAILAYRRKKKREDAMLESWDEQDAMFPPDPSWAAAEEEERGVDQIVADTLASPEPEPLAPSPRDSGARQPDVIEDGEWVLGEDGWERK